MSATQKMNFYICVSLHEANDHRTIYEERLTLIKASSRKEAMDKAQQIVKAATESYKTRFDKTITRTCRRIVQVTRVIDSTFSDGGQLCSRGFLSLDEYERFEAECDWSV